VNELKHALCAADKYLADLIEQMSAEKTQKEKDKDLGKLG
jgi:hypothetical protein